MNPLELYEQMAIHFPPVGPEDHSWVNVHDGKATKLAVLAELLVKNIQGEHAIAVVHSKPGVAAELPIGDIVDFIAPYVLQAEIQVTDPSRTSFVAVLTNGVATGWSTPQ